MKKIIFISLICGFLGACGGSYFNSNIKTKYPAGLKLYLSKCSGCHRLYERKEYTPEKWSEIMFRMQKKSNASDEQIDKIYNFLTERDSVGQENKTKTLSEN
ncbi:MAG: hypothetical protein WB996_00285 [Ignavibacteriaceae bacterium]